uniref:Uncharacterized protein n=1 Tax=Podoviridae sp. ctiwu7 TaxID=2825269 RepID=A0A8S5QB88_9CAUD|nr:MAG TPA: hypothetical protein [Podoviridae sp. ctiwu7]
MVPKAGASADERLLRSPRLPHPSPQKAFTRPCPCHHEPAVLPSEGV